jgi:hypothetical protein
LSRRDEIIITRNDEELQQDYAVSGLFGFVPDLSTESGGSNMFVIMNI